MDQNNRFTQIEELLSEVLRNQDKQTEILQQQTAILGSHSQKLDSIVNTYDTGFNAMLKKMDEFTFEIKGLRQDFAKFADHEERLKKIEQVVFKKGA